MNERVPDSSGLPLRAMVMVLLFLGGIFLLVAFQAMSSGNRSNDQAATTTSSAATSTTTITSVVPAPRPEVRVYNISEVPGAAARVADQLREADWNVTETGNLELPHIVETTVYFGPAEGEQEAAAEVGELLQAPVVERIPEVAEQPPGVIVVVTG